VEGHIVEQGKAPKVIVFKYKRRKRFRRKNGHRQEFTAVRIDSIKAKGAKAPKTADPKAEAKTEGEESAAKKAAPQKTVAKETATKKAAPEKETAKKTEAKKAAPQKVAAKKEDKDK